MLGTTRKRWDKHLWNSYNEAVSVTNMSASIRGHCGRLLGPVWLQMCFLWLLPSFKFWINCQKVKIGRFHIKARISSFPENLAIPGLRVFFPLWGKMYWLELKGAAAFGEEQKLSPLPFVMSKSTVWQHLVPRPLPSSVVLVQCLDVLEPPSLVAINFLVCSHPQGGSTVSYWCSIGKWTQESM